MIRKAAARREPPDATRLESAHRRALYAVFAALAGSGGAWLVLHYFGRVETEWGDGPHPLEIWSLRLHGLAAMATLVGLGTLILTHMRRAWRARQNRASGGALAALLAVLAASGYALYYFGGEETRPLISLVHWVLGIAVVWLLAAHVAIGHRLRARPRRSRPASPRRRPGASAAGDHALHAEGFAGLDGDPELGTDAVSDAGGA